MSENKTLSSLLKFRVSEEFKAEVDALAKSLGISTGGLARLALNEYMQGDIADEESLDTDAPHGWIDDEIADPAFTDLSGITETVDAIARLSDALVNVGAYLDEQVAWDARDEWTDPRPGIVRLIHHITTAALEV